MECDLITTLRTCGYLSRQQLSAIFSLTPEEMILEPWMLWYRDALWDSARFRKGRHRAHWELTTQTYLAFAPQLAEWTADPGDGEARADALIRLIEAPYWIALEIDTGKENQQQWQDKLVRYRHMSPHERRLLVVAAGKSLRLRQLSTWLKQSPLPWALLEANKLPPHEPLNWHGVLSPEESVPSSEQSVREVIYWLDGAPLDPIRANFCI